MLFKKKSVVVGLVSSLVIALVLVLTLIGYFIYLEIKAQEFRRCYQELLGTAKAKVYAKHIVVSGLDTRIENSGPLKGKAVLEGTVTNKGSREVWGLVLKAAFLDKDNAVLYEFLVHPHEPALGTPNLPQVTIPYLYNPPKESLKQGEVLHFKNIITNCPTEIFVELREGNKPKNSSARWSGAITAKAASLEF